MRKVFLLRTEPAPLETELVEDKRYIFEATEHESVKEVSIYNEQEILIARHFVQKREYATYFLEPTEGAYMQYDADSWSESTFANAMLSMLNIGYVEGESFKKVFKSVSHLKDEEWNINLERMNTRYQNKQERINDIMITVPEATKSLRLRSWARQIFPNEIFEYDKEKKASTYYCTECGQIFLAEHFKRNTKIKCKCCGRYGLVKTGNGGQEYKSFITYQPAEGRRVWQRHWEVVSESMPGHLREREIHERIRLLIDFKTNQVKIFYGQYQGGDESSQAWWDKRDPYGMMLFRRKELIYPKCDIESCHITPIGLKNTLIEAQRRGDLGDWNNLVRYFHNCPEIEYVYKAGFGILAQRLIGNASYYQPSYRVLDKFRSLNKEQKRRLKTLGGDPKALDWLIRETKPIPEEMLQYISKIKVNPRDLSMDETRLDSVKMLRYMQKICKKESWTPNQFADYYRDYIRMAAEQGADVTDDIIRRTSDLKKWHDRCVEEDIKRKAAAEAKEDKLQDKKFSQIKKDFKRNQSIFNDEIGEYTFRPVKNVIEMKNEGRAQHHCVGATETYMSRMAKRESFIILMRKKKEPKTAYYTIEIEESGHVRQSYAAYDRQPDFGQVSKALKKYSKNVRFRSKAAKKKLKKSS